MFSKKHVSNIVIPNLPNFGETYLSTGANIPKVPPMSGDTRGNILNELIQNSKNLKEIYTTLTTRKSIIDSLIQMMNPKSYATSTSEATSQDAKIVFETFGKNEEQHRSEEGKHVEYESISNDYNSL